MKIKLVCLLIISAKLSFSQDIHFSQNFIDRVHLNPSLIGEMTKNNYRVSLQRKSQWQSVSVPFSTFSSTFEIKNIYKNVNIGVQFLNDKSGTSSINLNQLNIGISRSFPLSNISKIGFGGVVGIAQKNISYENLLFETQENFLINNLSYFDLGLGTYYKNNHQNLFWSLGYSIYHLNNPNISFNNDESVDLPLKSNLFLKVDYPHSHKLLIHSELIVTKQSSQKEIIFGIKPDFELKNIIVSPLSYYRFNDAIILGFGIKKNNLQANLTYDINISDLSIASNNKSGFEFSIIYLWKKKKKEIKLKESICPKYL
tara:strand:+ start:580 stop:1521 length:942 start_codon:yes stop_codon:yes gene_type:complete